MIVDDDAMTREVLQLIAADAGYIVEAFESGDAALESGYVADIVVADLQMPGVAGNTLARLLRPAAPQAVLVAMSGTAVPVEQTCDFDGFLLKPFSIEDLSAAVHKMALARPAPPAADAVLSESIYASLMQLMPREQMGQLYAMSLNDADARIGQMRMALAAGDDSAYRRAAHSIKGGCGMVGALELARLAARMEEDGLKGVDKSVPPRQELDEFLIASAKLRRILDSL
jgi:CheY-like chemotaxis protein/HPt (histidine-containing phosphotransfer) domain-containing protein